MGFTRGLRVSNRWHLRSERPIRNTPIDACRTASTGSPPQAAIHPSRGTILGRAMLRFACVQLLLCWPLLGEAVRFAEDSTLKMLYDNRI